MLGSACQDGPVSNKPGRHETSLGGLIGAMIVLVACILGFVGFRELTREVPENKPQAMEWQPLVESAQGQGHEIAVPEVPEKWIVTNIRFEPTLHPTWEMSFFTDEEKYAGLRQEDERLDTLVEARVDKEAKEGDPVTISTGDFAGEWRTFTDEGGDFALAHEDPEGVVLVFGSAPREDLIELASTLRTSNAVS